jgi:hypothetical protein
LVRLATLRELPGLAIFVHELADAALSEQSLFARSLLRSLYLFADLETSTVVICRSENVAVANSRKILRLMLMRF